MVIFIVFCATVLYMALGCLCLFCFCWADAVQWQRDSPLVEMYGLDWVLIWFWPVFAVGAVLWWFLVCVRSLWKRLTGCDWEIIITAIPAAVSRSAYSCAKSQRELGWLWFLGIPKK